MVYVWLFTHTGGRSISEIDYPTEESKLGSYLQIRAVVMTVVDRAEVGL